MSRGIRGGTALDLLETTVRIYTIILQPYTRSQPGEHGNLGNKGNGSKNCAGQSRLDIHTSS